MLKVTRCQTFPYSASLGYNTRVYYKGRVSREVTWLFAISTSWDGVYPVQKNKRWQVGSKTDWKIPDYKLKEIICLALKKDWQPMRPNLATAVTLCERWRVTNRCARGQVLPPHFRIRSSTLRQTQSHFFDPRDTLDSTRPLQCTKAKAYWPLSGR